MNVKEPTGKKNEDTWESLRQYMILPLQDENTHKHTKIHIEMRDVGREIGNKIGKKKGEK